MLRRPARVLRVLAGLRPMAAVGPVSLAEVRNVLSERLLSLEIELPARRYGRVFVGSPHQARGRAFRVVFIPGLAERMFPQKPREDPLLLDEQRGTRAAAPARAAAGRSSENRASAASPRRRRGDRAASPLISATRNSAGPAARPVVLRARRHARDHRPHPQPRGPAARRVRGGLRDWRGPRPRIPNARSTSGARPGGAAGADRRARSGKGEEGTPITSSA